MEELRVMVMVVHISFIQPKIKFEPQYTTKLLFGIKQNILRNLIVL